MNKLVNQTSPYLKMHANNPVNWYPWGEEAFAEAKRRDMPIFLSIGYSSCHWCHVIARESFEDTEVAEILNASYISVKVDKEERPDVDAVYMDAVQLATGAGGWPMTLLIMPSGEPFYAATYLPKRSLIKLLTQAAELWKTNRAYVESAAADLVKHMRKLADAHITPKEPSMELAKTAVKAFAASFDNEWGGFGRAPKFPAAHNLLFLMEYYERTGDKVALHMTEKTLNAMYAGGIFDHVGGGFCRYSVDREWLIPHFEKMLYDNALLIWAYAKAYGITKNELYAKVAKRTADYVLREMTGDDGEFFCAQDADSEGREGAYYLFSRGELLELLGRDGERFCERYDITDNGNFEGLNIPNLIGKPYAPDMDDLLKRVYEYRKRRMRLMRDDKALTSWNALMITALCEAAAYLNEPSYLAAATRAEAFIRNKLTGASVLADYAYYLLALAALYENTGDDEHRARGEQVMHTMLTRFGSDDGGLYMYGSDAENLVTRPKDTWDSAMPSGNSAAALAMLKLDRRAADKLLRYVAGAAERNPMGHGFALYAVTKA